MKRYFTMIMTVAVLVAIGLVAGCDSSDTAKSGTTSSLTEDQQQMPDFFLEMLDGGTISRDELLGSPTVINFGASWCGPCEEEAPTLKKVSDAHQDVKFLGIAVKDSPAAQKQFAEKFGWNFPIALDSRGTVVTDFQKEALMPQGAIPTTFFIDSKGHFVDVYLGPISESGLEQGISALIEADAANQTQSQTATD